jgi:hypothetical protein
MMRAHQAREQKLQYLKNKSQQLTSSVKQRNEDSKLALTLALSGRKEEIDRKMEKASERHNE